MVSCPKNMQRRFSLAVCHTEFLTMLPAIQQHARRAFRHLGPEAREEAVQNVVTNTWAALVALARRGKLELAYPTVLAGYGVRQTRSYRLVGSKLNANDVSSTYAQRRKNFVVERLDRYDEDEGVWSEVLVEDRTATPAEIAASRIDFPAWLKTLSSRDRRVALKLAAGETTSSAAQMFGVSPGRVSQLRTELKAAWDRFQGAEERPHRAAVAA